MMHNICLRVLLRLASILYRATDGRRVSGETSADSVAPGWIRTHFTHVGPPFLTMLAVALLAAPAVSSFGAVGPEVSYSVRKVLGVPTSVVIADLNNSSIAVEIALARKGMRTSEPFGSIVSRTKPLAAITGTFFCTKSLIPVGDIVTGGRYVHAGRIGSCLAITPDNQAFIFPTDKGVKMNWGGFSAGLRAGPQLMSGGVISINGKREGFRDSAVLKGRRIRTAVGVTVHNKLLLVAVRIPVTLSELAKIMRALGAVDAINLDGGSSTGLSYGGKVVVRPARRMTNVLLITKRKYQPAAVPKALDRVGSTASVVMARKPVPELKEARSPASPSKPEATVVRGPEEHAMLPQGAKLFSPHDL